MVSVMRSASMTERARRARAKRVLPGLRELYPQVDCALDHADAFQLLAATILSAQCTDKTVNTVTPALFRRYPNPAAMARAAPAALEKLVYSTGFYRNKAKNLRAMAKTVVEQHGGEVPRTMDELLGLPGVARKTANVVLGTAWGVAVGIVVDTHVQRLSQRLALTEETAPVAIERDLMRIVPQADWIWLAHALIWHGRLVCDAKRPRCGECTLARICPAAATFAA
ncbi:MAG: endonuclease III [Planctomycetes bacterium]|jgi:endonuclease-3|nr:endonuclease III [Planctomycetota bacterium]